VEKFAQRAAQAAAMATFVSNKLVLVRVAAAVQQQTVKFNIVSRV